MELITYYFAFCVIVAIMASVDLIRPVLNKMENVTTEFKILFYIVSFCMSMLVAPVLLRPCLSKTRGAEFREGFLEGALKG